MPRYRVSRKALGDLDAIWLFIAKDNEAAAERQMQRLASTFRAIAGQPRMGRARPEIGEHIRSFVVDDYVIFYQASRSGVSIVRLWDGRRDPGKLPPILR